MNFYLLKQKNFLLLMMGKLVSLIGSQMQSFALSLYILRITGSAAQFAGVLSVTIIPQIVFGPFIGVLVDWLDRKKIIVLLDMFNGVLIGVYAALYFINGGLSIRSIYILAIVLSLFSLMFDPAITTIIPSIMKQEEIPDANAINSSIMSIGELIAPAIAGVLFGLFGLPIILVINSLSFIFSSISEMFIDIPKTNKSIEKISVKVFKSDFVEGLKFIKSKKLIFASLFIALLLNFSSAPIDSIGVAYVSKQVLKVSDYQFGLLESVVALAMIVGPLFIGRLSKKMSNGKMLYWSFLLEGIVIAVMAIVPTPFFRGLFSTSIVPYLSSLVLLFAIGLLISIANVAFGIIIQTEVPLSLMGRVDTVATSCCMAAMPLGQMLFGVLFDKIPAWICYAITAAIFIFGVILFKNKLLYSEDESKSYSAISGSQEYDL